MKKLMMLAMIVISLAGLGVMSNALGARASLPPDSDLILPGWIMDPTNTPASPLSPQSTNTPAPPVDPTNTPAPPVDPTNTPAPPRREAQLTLDRLPSSVVVNEAFRNPASEARIADQPLQDTEGYTKWAQRHTDAHFQVEPLSIATEKTSPHAPSQTCRDMILNPQMDVVDFGDGTGTVDYWSILAQKIYFDDRAGYYNSASHSLVMVDDPGNDSEIISSTLDYDALGQGFQSPSGLTSVTVYYSRLYSQTNDADEVWGSLWYLDEEGALVDWVVAWQVGESPSGWSNRSVSITDPSPLAALSGQRLGLLFELFSDRNSPYEFIWLDDAQVEMCYERGPSTIYFPLIIKDPPPSPPVPTCRPYEPDSVSQRGTTVVDVVCGGSFNPLDIKDYYTLDLDGTSEIRLRLFNLPSGSNWDAMIYEDASNYPLACHIGTAGDDDKYADCTLNPGKNYFVLVNAGTAPGSNKTYQMSVESREDPTATPTATTPPSPSGPRPGFWDGNGMEFYVTTDRANVDDFAIYISVDGCGNYKITHTAQESISSSQFSFSGSFYASGTFGSETTASGSAGLDHFYIDGCGYITGGPFSWSATWQDYSQPTSAYDVEPERVEPKGSLDESYKEMFDLSPSSQ